MRSICEKRGRMESEGQTPRHRGSNLGCTRQLGAADEAERGIFRIRIGLRMAKKTSGVEDPFFDHGVNGWAIATREDPPEHIHHRGRGVVNLRWLCHLGQVEGSMRKCACAGGNAVGYEVPAPEPPTRCRIEAAPSGTVCRLSPGDPLAEAARLACVA